MIISKATIQNNPKHVYISREKLSKTLSINDKYSIIIKGESSLDGILLFVDLKNLNFDKIPILKNPTCSICSEHTEYTTDFPLDKWVPLDICGGENFMLVPQMKMNYDIDKIKSQIEHEFSISKIGTHSLSLKLSNNALMTIFKGGNVLIRGAKTPQVALQIWEDIKGFLM